MPYPQKKIIQLVYNSNCSIQSNTTQDTTIECQKIPIVKCHMLKGSENSAAN